MMLCLPQIKAFPKFPKFPKVLKRTGNPQRLERRAPRAPGAPLPGAVPAPQGPGRRRAGLGKGQMGSALMGSLLMICFLTGTFWVLPLTYFYHPTIHYLSAPLVLTPFVRNQRTPSCHTAPGTSLPRRPTAAQRTSSGSQGEPLV